MTHRVPRLNDVLTQAPAWCAMSEWFSLRISWWRNRRAWNQCSDAGAQQYSNVLHFVMASSMMNATPFAMMMPVNVRLQTNTVGRMWKVNIVCLHLCTVWTLALVPGVGNFIVSQLFPRETILSLNCSGTLNGRAVPARRYLRATWRSRKKLMRPRANFQTRLPPFPRNTREGKRQCDPSWPKLSGQQYVSPKNDSPIF